MLFVLLVLALGALDAVALTLLIPTNLLEASNRSVQWHEGTPSYVFQANSVNPTKNLYTYAGNDEVVWWVVGVPAGTVVQFSVTDSGGAQAHSAELTVQPNSVMSLQSVASTQSLASLSSISVTSTSSTGPLTSTQQSSRPTHSSSTSSSKAGAIGGGVGGVIVLALIGAIVFILRRRRRARFTSGNNATESVGMVYPSGYSPLDGQGSPPRSSQPELSAYPTSGGVATPTEPLGRPVTAPSMMTAPGNEDEEYYNRVVRRQDGYIQASRPRGFPAIPEIG